MDLQSLGDRVAIDDLLTAYTVAIDSHDWDRLDTVFTPDAQLDHTASGGRTGSFSEMKAWLAETLPRFTGTQHFVTQKDVRLAGDDATVRAYFLDPLAIEREDGTRRRRDVGGVYAHELVRTDGGRRSRRLVEEVPWHRQEGWDRGLPRWRGGRH